jgi:predicted PurR-regulated permease PerM
MILVATMVLYRGRAIILPITSAVILALVFSPIAGFLERYIGRAASSAVAALLVVAVVVIIGYLFVVGLTTVATQVSAYADNIAAKLHGIQKNSHVVNNLKHTLTTIQNSFEPPPRTSRSSSKVIATAPSFGLLSHLDFSMGLPIIDVVVQAALITILLFFLLYSRYELRDRFVRLAARAEITIAPQAIELAGRSVARYLLMLSGVNLTIGCLCGTAVWLLGIPDASLWGALAMMMRFIPYVGTIASATLPALIAFAVFPGWAKFFEVIAVYIACDQVAAQFLEPFVVGPEIDLMPVALLVATMYWSWLWGLPGLLLAAPITVCVKIAGDHISALSFFQVLLGAEQRLQPYHHFYRLLLERDKVGARTLAVDYWEDYGLSRTFNRLLTPALLMTGDERAAQNINQETEEFIIAATRELIEELGTRSALTSPATSIRGVALSAPGEVHDLGLMMVSAQLRQLAIDARLISASDNLESIVGKGDNGLVLLSCTTEDALPGALECVARLRQHFPQLIIVGGGPAAMGAAWEMQRAGCDAVCLSAEEARHVVRRLMAASHQAAGARHRYAASVRNLR